MAFNAQGAAQGAAAGAAVGSVIPVVGTLIGGAVGGIMGAMSKPPGSSGGTSGPGASGGPVATPSSSQAAAYGSGLDGSGWVINFGNGNSVDLNNAQDKTIRATQSADATATQSPYLPGYGSGMGGLAGDALGIGIPPVVWIALFGFAAWRLYSSKK